MTKDNKHLEAWAGIQSDCARGVNVLRLAAARRRGTQAEVLLLRAVERLRQATRLVDRASAAAIAEEVE